MATQAAFIQANDDIAVRDARSHVQATCSQVACWQDIVDDSFVAQWDKLSSIAAEPNAFAESWFLLPALRQFDPAGAVRLFTLYDGGKLVGMMPLAAQARYGRWPLPHIQNWMHHNAFLGTPLVASGHERAFWATLLSVLDSDPGSNLFAHFNGLTHDGTVARALASECAGQGRTMALVHQEERALLEGDLSPEAYLEASVRGKKRKELRRQKNRISDLGELTFSRHLDDAGLDIWAHEFLALERAGWKGENGSALDCAPTTRTLFMQALNGAAARGKLERLELRLDGAPLAMLVNFLCPPGSFSFKTAFDEAYSRYSPGVLLQIENLVLLKRTGIDWCDSCAAEGHPMIDSLWMGRRSIARYSVAIGGAARRMLFSTVLRAELARGAGRTKASANQPEEDER